MVRELRKQEVADATKAYAANNGKTTMVNDAGGIILMPGDVVVSCDNGKLVCNDPAIKEAIAEIIMEMAQDAPRQRQIEDKPPRPANTAIEPKSSRSGALVRPGTIRDVQVADLTMQDIKEFICPDANDQEAFMFLKLCQARNLNPFTRECYLIKYGGKTNMVVGKEAFTRKAELNPQFDGFEAGIIVKQKDGKFLDLPGTFYDDSEDKLVGGWAEVHRKDRTSSFIARVSLKEYSKGQATWKDMPCVMIRKVALVSALREAFPSDLAGMYDQSELGIDPEKEIAPGGKA